ncbi:MAG TPA: LptF/LptG family permease, partial [Flavobacteriaceae bacterium]|nr:LptF/LptG family permease [Flavobacteriaceae bacterium]
MKILDRYIFFSFVKTFFAVFVILILIFLLQSVWTYISELAGKDLDAWIIARLLFYIIPNLIPMVLPLTILVASIMTFGNFAENYEFAAMKASGISLQRAMRSLIFFITILSVTTFFFANDVIPWSRFKTINMRRNIAKMKPAMSIEEGIFNQINEYNIKVDKKSGKDGEYLHDVIIHLKNPGERGLTVVKAKEGKLKSSENSNLLELTLYDGTLYQRQFPRDYRQRQKRPFIKNNFESYKFNIDLSGFNEVDFDDNKYDNAASMLNIAELRVSLDSLSQRFNQDRKNFSGSLMARNGMERILRGVAEDTTAQVSIQKSLEKAQSVGKRVTRDLPEKEVEVEYDINSLQEFYDSYDTNLKMQMTNLALTSTQGTLRTI